MYWQLSHLIRISVYSIYKKKMNKKDEGSCALPHYHGNEWHDVYLLFHNSSSSLLFAVSVHLPLRSLSHFILKGKSEFPRFKDVKVMELLEWSLESTSLNRSFSTLCFHSSNHAFYYLMVSTSVKGLIFPFHSRKCRVIHGCRFHVA